MAALLAAGLVGGGVAWATSVQRAFDQGGWLASDGVDGSRLAMADDLVGRGALEGLTGRELTALLGPPTYTDKWGDWDVVYVLGPCRCLFPIDYEWLVIRLERGRVVEARIVQD